MKFESWKVSRGGLRFSAATGGLRSVAATGGLRSVAAWSPKRLAPMLSWAAASVLLLGLCSSAHAITATKEYVDRRDAEIRTNTYTKAETDAAIAAKPHITTNDVIGLIGSHAPAPGDYATVSNRAMSALTRQEAINGFTEWTTDAPVPAGWHIDFVANLWWLYVDDFPYTEASTNDSDATELKFSDYTIDAGGGLMTTPLFKRTRLPTMADIPTNNLQLINGAGYVTSTITNGLVTTNDVCAIVTNDVPWWTFSPPSIMIAGALRQIYAELDDISGDWRVLGGREEYPLGPVLIPGESSVFRSASDDGEIEITATWSPRNTLGLARLSDLPTNHVTQAELEAAIDAIPVPEIDTSKLATKQQLQAVSNEAQVVYRLFSGSNVVAEVTNYNSRVNAPQLRLLQLNESNEYFTVWSETNGLTRTLNSANTHTDSAINDLATSCALTYAPRAWSRTTSGLGAEAPSNTTWISTPTTVIAGGLEYAKVVHANGAVWVLSGNGMMNFDPTTNAYLRISADDGTEIFSIEKTDAVTVGAYAEGITVSGNVVTIPVPVVSVDHPTMYWRDSLESGGWADESEINGRLGGGYEWTGSSGAWVCTAWVPDGLPPSLFFKFTYEQPGSTVIKNGAAVDVSGGIMCTDGIHKCRPVYNNGSITWEVVP